MVECCVYYNEISVDCDINFIIYCIFGCGFFCWKGMWIGCLVIMCLVGLFIVLVLVVNRYIY